MLHQAMEEYCFTNIMLHVVLSGVCNVGWWAYDDRKPGVVIITCFMLVFERQMALPSHIAGGVMAYRVPNGESLFS